MHRNRLITKFTSNIIFIIKHTEKVRMQQHYDVIIIGSGMGGLVLAIFLPWKDIEYVFWKRINRSVVACRSMYVTG